ncbi:hypothetical protein AB0K80_32815 [Streptomyces sp. NPDC052682]|uniref:hypothetical protein n=1 Tax=Streptomyces sp. NPDC052682 TaxID=3154954 RepID=UPI003422D4B8
MNQVKEQTSDLPQPLRAVASGLRHLPGAQQVGKVAGGTLDRIGAVSPRGRRMAVYAGAGVLGVAGVVEWPVALTGAAVAWLTQPRPEQRTGQDTADGGEGTADAGQDSAPAAAAGGTGEGEGPGAARSTRYGAGDRLESAHFRRNRPEHHVHDEPAKVGDTATASALKQVAEATHHGPATEHHGTHTEPPGRETAGRHADTNGRATGDHR